MMGVRPGGSGNKQVVNTHTFSTLSGKGKCARMTGPLLAAISPWTDLVEDLSHRPLSLCSWSLRMCHVGPQQCP